LCNSNSTLKERTERRIRTLETDKDEYLYLPLHVASQSGEPVTALGEQNVRRY
jgi:hypothetical protein